MRISFVLICLAGLVSQADQMAVAQHVADPQVAQLAHVTLFAFGGVGFAGSASAGQKNYDAIMARANRLELLEKVFETGTPEAKSYALAGINNLNSARFKALAAELRLSTAAVNTAHGCILSRSTLGGVIRQIEAGGYAHYL